FEAGSLDLLLDDGIGVATQLEPLLRHLAEDTDREPGSWKGLPPHDGRRKAQQFAHAANLVLEELAERLDQLELHLRGQPADVVMSLDGRRRPFERQGLDDVRVERSLSQPGNVARSEERRVGEEAG